MFNGHQSLFKSVVLSLDSGFLALKLLNLLSLSLTRGLSGLTVPKDTLNASLFFFIFRFRPFPKDNVSIRRINRIDILMQVHTEEEGWSSV